MSENPPEPEAPFTEPDPRVPEALSRAMRGSDPVAPADDELLDALDRRVLTRARAQLDPPRGRADRRWWTGWNVSVGLVAACLLIALTIRVTMSLDAPVIAGDLDRDGTVNIVDSFQLAQMIEQNQQPPEHADFNRDGLADGRDVADMLAYHVRLPDDLPPQRRGGIDGQRQFIAVDVWITSPEPVAAASLALANQAAAQVELVGLENGSAPYDTPPVYDARAMGRDRIILATQLTPPQLDQLKQQPRPQRFRLTTLHVYATEQAARQWALQRPVFVDLDGQAIDAQQVKVTFEINSPQSGETL